MPRSCCSRKPSALPKTCSSAETSRFGGTFGRPSLLAGSGGHCLARSRASDFANSSTCLLETEPKSPMGMALCPSEIRASTVLKDLLGYLWKRSRHAPRSDVRTAQELRRAFDVLLNADEYARAREIAEQALARG